MTWKRSGDGCSLFIRDRGPSHVVMQLIISVQWSPFTERVKCVMSHHCCKIAITPWVGEKKVIEANHIYSDESWCFSGSRGRRDLHTDLHAQHEPSHPSWVLGAVCHPLLDCSKISSGASSGEVNPPKRACRAPQAKGLFHGSPFSCTACPSPGWGHTVGWGWDRPGTCQRCFGFGTMENHQLPSLPHSLPPSLPPPSLNLFLSSSASRTGP